MGFVLMISALEGWAIRALTKRRMHLSVSELYASEGVVETVEEHWKKSVLSEDYGMRLDDRIPVT
jgi:hypothetical protein